MCVTRDEFLRMKESQAAAAGAPLGGGSAEAPAQLPAVGDGAAVGTTSTPAIDASSTPVVLSPSSPANHSEPPVIHINGANPAHINVGDTYNDLGATITPHYHDCDLSGLKKRLPG